jgi:hypothetical protein
VAKLNEGYDLVNGWRVDRQTLSPSPVTFPNCRWIIGLTTQVKIHDYGCTLKVSARRRQKSETLRRNAPFHPALVGDLRKITEMPVTHHPRKRGASKYGLARTLWVILDL